MKLCFALSVLLMAAPAGAEVKPFPAARTALVMGAWNYTDATFPRLPESGIHGDLTRMKTKLETLGFEVTLVENPSLKQAKAAVDLFGARLKSRGGASLFYFTGHGAEHEGKNYLIPVGTDVIDARDLDDEALSANRVLDRMEASGVTVNLVFLDCCRNALTKTGDDVGMAQMRAKGALIGYATRSGDVAATALTGSPYTGALVAHLGDAGTSLADMHSLVTEDIVNGGTPQRPGFYNDISGIYHLVPGNESGSPSSATREAVGGATRERPYVNTLGMEFIPLPGQAGVLMCRTETRVRDFRAYAAGADYMQTGGANVMQVTKDKEGNPTGTTWEVDPKASWEKPGFAQSEEHAVCCVSLDEAEAFCAWLSKQEGKKYRLPTDAEWSAAVGVGKYPWGSAWPPPKGAGNYAGTEWAKDLPKANWAVAYEYSDGQARTGPVGSFEENRNGFYDLGGNVWEWCSDRYRSSMNSAEVLEEIPALKEETASDGTPYRVLRGGSWFSVDPSALLSSDRYNDPPGARGDDRGFRVVLVVGSGG